MIELGQMKNKKLKEKTIEKWSKLGLLEGLEGNVNENCAQLFENQLSYVINESSGNTTSKFNEIKFPVIKLK